MHTLSAAFILGYHGCDATTAEKLLSGQDFKFSNNNYDWLGSGIYFWEANPKRGLEFAQELAGLDRGPKITDPAVVGAVVDLDFCLDLTTSAGLDQVNVAFQRLEKINEASEKALPENNEDGLRRNLDCAVIQMLHLIRDEKEMPPIDSVKGVFVEGDPVYCKSGFHHKTHIQICVCNPDCIKGVFRVPQRFLD
jgi:hypothetical protein